MCGKGIIFIDTFHTIRVLSNFAGRAGYATFPPRRPPGKLRLVEIGHDFYISYTLKGSEFGVFLWKWISTCNYFQFRSDIGNCMDGARLGNSMFNFQISKLLMSKSLIMLCHPKSNCVHEPSGQF